MVSLGHAHGVAPKGKWLVVVSARVEGSLDDVTPLAVAKRELAAAFPLLKPARKMFAEVTPYCEPDSSSQQSGLHVFSSCDESSYFDSVEEDVERVLESITGESAVAGLRRS
jgi:RAB protein geranylgeranyltransferase component A